jgi:hypothetical protein
MQFLRREFLLAIRRELENTVNEEFRLPEVQLKDPSSAAACFGRQRLGSDLRTRK